MNNREYRRLTVEDTDRVVTLNDTFRSGFASLSEVGIFLINPQNWFFACIEEDQIIGFAYGYELNRLDHQGNMLYLHEVSVLPQFQRQSIGSQLLSEVKSLSRLMGICKIFLLTQKSNTAACHLYEKSGGEKSGEKGDDVVYSFKIN